MSYSNHHIDAKIGGGDDPAWKFSGFYGYPKTALRSRSWNLLIYLRCDNELPWIGL